MIQNNIVFKVSLISGLTLVIGGVTAKSNKSDYAIVIPTEQRSVEMTQDSTYILFSLENDTVFIGKNFPPVGYKIDEGTLIATDTNISEYNAIREMVRSSIDSNRYSELKAHSVWLGLIIYVDSTGIIQETQIRLDQKFREFLHTDDLRNICLSVKGLKFTIPPQYSHLPYYRFYQGVSFK
ncbi:MAG: hypothetical protein RBT02_08175 [Bacteroidales bacterium]|jgi:hypothetical protein|nr:hypothetical protein [Bacteroidales bacterium]